MRIRVILEDTAAVRRFGTLGINDFLRFLPSEFKVFDVYYNDSENLEVIVDIKNQ